MESCSFDSQSGKYFWCGTGLGVGAGFVATIFLHLGMALFSKSGFSDNRFGIGLPMGLIVGIPAA